MGQVTISAVVFEIYDTEQGANDYFKGSLFSTEWSGFDSTLRKQALVTAARWFDRLKWRGAKTVDSQPLAWPRTGIPDVDSGIIPQQVFDGSFELAFKLAQDATIQDTLSTGSNVKKVKAGPAEVEFFTNTKGQQFPAITHQLVGEFLAAGGSLACPFASGTSETSKIPSSTDFGLDRGFA